MYARLSQFFALVQEGKVKIVRPRVIAPDPQAPAVPSAQAPKDDADAGPTNAQALISEAMVHLKLGVYEAAARL